MASKKKGSGGDKKTRKPAAKKGKSSKRAPKKQTNSKRAPKKQSKAVPKQHEKSSIAFLNYRLMKALSHELRVEIFSILIRRVASPNELANELGEGLSQVSYHVKVLKEYGFIELEGTEQRRGAVEHYYRAVQPTLIPPGTWDNISPDIQKGVSVNTLKAFFEDASASLEAGIFDNDPGSLGWTSLSLDSLGLAEIAKLAREFHEDIANVQAKASKRHPRTKGKSSRDLISATVFLAHFLSTRSFREGKSGESSAKLR